MLTQREKLLALITFCLTFLFYANYANVSANGGLGDRTNSKTFVKFFVTHRVSKPIFTASARKEHRILTLTVT